MTSRRDQVMDAMLAYLQAKCTTTFKSYSRRFQTWEVVVQRSDGPGSIKQPALFLFDGVGLGGGVDSVDSRGRSFPAIITMSRTIVIYARLPGGGTPQGPDSTTPGGTVLYPLFESVLSAFETHDATDENALTLGGLVFSAVIDGDVHYITGEIDDGQGQGMLTIPIKLMMSPFSQ